MKIKACPFCGAETTYEEKEKDYWAITHMEDCWIVQTGFITEYCVQEITNSAMAEAWNSRKGESK